MTEEVSSGGFRPLNAKFTPPTANQSAAFQPFVAPPPTPPPTQQTHVPPTHSTPIREVTRRPQQLEYFYKKGSCPSPGADSAFNDSGNNSSANTTALQPMIRRTKPKDDARLREHRKCLGLTVLARRGDTFRQSQVIEIRDDGYIGVMMKGDTNLTFFLQPEASGNAGPKSPRDGLSGVVGGQEVCMLIDDEYDPQYTYTPNMRAAVNMGRDVFRECTILRHDFDAVLVRIDPAGGDEHAVPTEKKVRPDQLRPFVPPWHSQRDNTQILARLRTTSRGVMVDNDDNKMMANGTPRQVTRHEEGETDTASENDEHEDGNQERINQLSEHNQVSRPSSVNSVSEGSSYNHKFRKGEVVTQNTGVRKKFNGKQWRRLCSKGDCIKESQRKGFCSRHLSDNKGTKTRQSRPPSSVPSELPTPPPIRCTSDGVATSVSALEREAANVLISLKNTPSRSATPASSVPPGLYSPSPSPVGRGLSPARTGHMRPTYTPCRATSITPTLAHRNPLSFRTPVRITHADDSGIDSLVPTPNPHRSDISPAGGQRSTSPPIITEEPVRITSTQHLRHDTAKPEPKRETQHISDLLPILPTTIIQGKASQYVERPLNTTFPWHSLLPEFPAQLKQSPNSSFERPNGNNGPSGNSGGDYGQYEQNGNTPNGQPGQPPTQQGNAPNGNYDGGNQLPQNCHFATLQPVTVQQPIKQKPIKTQKDKTAERGPEMKKKEHIRRPMNAFMLFSKELRGEVHKRHPKKDNRSVSKLLGEMWTEMSDADKLKFQQQAADLKEKHYKDHPDWKWSNKDRRRTKVTQKLFDNNIRPKETEEKFEPVYATTTTATTNPPTKVMIKSGESFLVESTGNQYYATTQQQQQPIAPPPPPPPSSSSSQIKLKRPRTICPKLPKENCLELAPAMATEPGFFDGETATTVPLVLKHDHHEHHHHYEEVVEVAQGVEPGGGGESVYAVTMNNELVPIQYVVQGHPYQQHFREQQHHHQQHHHEVWSTSSSRSCSSTSSSGICSTASSDHENQATKQRKQQLDNGSPRRLARQQGQQQQEQQDNKLLKRKPFVDSAFAPPAKQNREQEYDIVSPGAV